MNAEDDAGLEWDASGAPRSRRFGDIYFSREDGLAESRAVFLAGCGLPQAWRQRRHFTVAELGFGTGLNIAALLDLWRREGPADGRLHIFSVEAYPLRRGEAARALAAWPDISQAADALLAAWPTQARGVRRVDLPGWRATLDLAVTDAVEALTGWDGRADAWFLDGFAPSTNPGMWREEVLALVAARSAPGARIATFTVAGAVRRGLQAAGLAVEKRPGHGRKRERLEVRAPGEGCDPPKPGRVAIVGAGIAGAALARAFDALDVEVCVLSGVGGAPAASGNPSALVTPRLDAGGGPVVELSAACFVRAAELYRAAREAIVAEGALQLEAAARDRSRFDRLASDPLYRDCGLERLDPAAAAARLGEPSNVGGLWMEHALVMQPAAVLQAWLGRATPVRQQVAAVAREDDEWRLYDPDGAPIIAADQVVFAAGYAARDLAGVNLQAVRGQASWATRREHPAAAAWGGYLTPTREGLLFGATHDRDDLSVDVREEDHRRNLDELARRRPALAASLGLVQLEGRAAVRATTADRLPIAGKIGAPGLSVLGGLGGRGFTFAPLLAEHVAATLCGLPSPLPLALQGLVDPGRFARRNSAQGPSG